MIEDACRASNEIRVWVNTLPGLFFLLLASFPPPLKSFNPGNKVTTVYNVHERLVDTQTMVYIMKDSNGNAYNVTVGDQKLQVGEWL